MHVGVVIDDLETHDAGHGRAVAQYRCRDLIDQINATVHVNDFAEAHIVEHGLGGVLCALAQHARLFDLFENGSATAAAISGAALTAGTDGTASDDAISAGTTSSMSLPSSMSIQQCAIPLARACCKSATSFSKKRFFQKG